MLSHIKKEYPNVLLRLVGNGEKAFLDNKIKELDLEKNVIFHNHNENKQLLFGKSSYLIMPSKREGFGIVLVEAQASGMYCFASNSISNSANLGGVIFLSLDDGPKKWADTITSFYKENKGIKSEFDCSDFTVEHFVNDVKKIYKIGA